MHREFHAGSSKYRIERGIAGAGHFRSRLIAARVATTRGLNRTPRSADALCRDRSKLLLRTRPTHGPQVIDFSPTSLKESAADHQLPSSLDGDVLNLSIPIRHQTPDKIVELTILAVSRHQE